MLKLDLGCGQNKCSPEHKGVDIWEGADIVHDLTKFPYPFEDNSVDEINASHFCEHLDGETFMKFMNECYRILKPANSSIHASATSGILKIQSPYYTSMRCWQDPTHKQAMSEAKFLYFNKKWLTDNKLNHYPIYCDFDYTFGYVPANPVWNSRSDEVKAFAFAHYNNTIADISVILTKRPCETIVT